jgi:hypothetical protein
MYSYTDLAEKDFQTPIVMSLRCNIAYTYMPFQQSIIPASVEFLNKASAHVDERRES